MKKSNNLYVVESSELDKTDDDYAAKSKYGYLTVAVSILNFIAILYVDNFLLHHSSAYFEILQVYRSSLHGFIRACLIIIFSSLSVVGCKSSMTKHPFISLLLYVISLVAFSFPLGVAMLEFPQMTVLIASQVTFLTLLFCLSGIFFQKKLSSWDYFLCLGSLGAVALTFVSRYFLFLSLVRGVFSYLVALLILGYFVYDVNKAMNSYTVAKQLGGISWISILLANSLDILRDTVIFFIEAIFNSPTDGGSNYYYDDHSDNESGGWFDSFW